MCYSCAGSEQMFTIIQNDEKFLIPYFFCYSFQPVLARDFGDPQSCHHLFDHKLFHFYGWQIDKPDTIFVVFLYALDYFTGQPGLSASSATGKRYDPVLFGQNEYGLYFLFAANKWSAEYRKIILRVVFLFIKGPFSDFNRRVAELISEAFAEMWGTSETCLIGSFRNCYWMLLQECVSFLQPCISNEIADCCSCLNPYFAMKGGTAHTHFIGQFWNAKSFITQVGLDDFIYRLYEKFISLIPDCHINSWFNNGLSWQGKLRNMYQ